LLISKNISKNQKQEKSKMFLKIKTIKFLIAAFVVLLPLGSNAFAQKNWLDQNSFSNWNNSSAIPQTKKISPAELKRCADEVRTPSLPADTLLMKKGWTLLGNPTEVNGDTAVVSVAGAFDGMCRPLKSQTFVFVGNKLAGTLSPALMDSRTDGVLTDVKLTSATTLTAKYARYRANDPLCCPWKTQEISFDIKQNGGNFLLTPKR
jgi:hypothetical protein